MMKKKLLVGVVSVSALALIALGVKGSFKSKADEPVLDNTVVVEEVATQYDNNSEAAVLAQEVETASDMKEDIDELIANGDYDDEAVQDIIDEYSEEDNEVATSGTEVQDEQVPTGIAPTVAPTTAPTTESQKCDHTNTKEVVVKEATCTRMGIMTIRCADCDKLLNVKIIKAKGHTYENDVCTVCGAKDKPGLWKQYNTTDATYKVTLPLANGMGNVSYVCPLDKNIKEVEIPKEVTIKGIKYQVTAIENNAFEGCNNLKTVKVGNEVTKIGKYAFANLQKLKKVTLPSSLKTIEKGAFKNCNKLDKISVPKNVKTIKKEAFAYCSDMKKATIGNSVKNIGRAAFAGCYDLKNVSIGKSVKTIEKEAFYNCSSLKQIAIRSTVVKKIGKNAIKGINSNAEIYIYEKCYDSVAPLFTAETGYQETMELVKKKTLLDQFKDWIYGDDEEETTDENAEVTE